MAGPYFTCFTRTPRTGSHATSRPIVDGARRAGRFGRIILAVRAPDSPNAGATESTGKEKLTRRGFLARPAELDAQRDRMIQAWIPQWNRNPSFAENLFVHHCTL